MALTRSFRETVAARANRDPEFRAALIEEAAQAFLEGDKDAARVLLRDAINATIGFHGLSTATGLPEKSLMRMVGPSGNPRLDSVSSIFRALNQHARIRMTAHAEVVYA